MERVPEKTTAVLRNLPVVRTRRLAGRYPGDVLVWIGDAGLLHRRRLDDCVCGRRFSRLNVSVSAVRQVVLCDLVLPQPLGTSLCTLWSTEVGHT